MEVPAGVVDRNDHTDLDHPISMSPSTLAEAERHGETQEAAQPTRRACSDAGGP